MTQSMNPSRAMNQCGARTRSGGSCKRPAGAGTDHVGFGKCKLHGGSSPNGRKHALKVQAAAVHEELAALVDLDTSGEDPLQGLLLAHRIKRMEVVWFTARIAELSPGDVTVRPLREELDKSGRRHDLRTVETVNLWIQLRDAALRDLARYAKMLIDAGLDERRVAAEERWAEDIAAIIMRVLDDVGLTARQQQRVPAIFQRVLGAGVV